MKNSAIGDDPPRRVDIIAPGVGQLDVAAGPDEKVGAKEALQFPPATRFAGSH
ncbi:hypothetical protein [Sphingopyxis fribergensis]|uniref:hypothetical protein n=1 Tax=Sphingopyxis fribergensis TaxID=1515612 RepID=UPI001E410FF6|nr:hypothetical protein [Sphingopyxis fribergensis]